MVEAIETNYNGYRFRSRLEARWAVFFDHLGIKFHYEPEGFKLASGWYLPDFWLPQVKMWAEVKRDVFSQNEAQLAFELSESTGFPCLMLDGEPDIRPYKSMFVMKGLGEAGKIISDDIGFQYCLVSSYLSEGNFFYFSKKDQALSSSEYGEDYRAAVFAARGYRFDNIAD